MEKYFIEIAMDNVTGYSPARGWDVLYETREEAMEAAERAAKLFAGARVSSLDAPSRVDHLYRNLADPHDATYLYE